jgi:hypothetical protein
LKEWILDRLAPSFNGKSQLTHPLLPLQIPKGVDRFVMLTLLRARCANDVWRGHFDSICTILIMVRTQRGKQNENW